MDSAAAVTRVESEDKGTVVEDKGSEKDSDTEVEKEEEEGNNSTGTYDHIEVEDKLDNLAEALDKIKFQGLNNNMEPIIYKWLDKDGRQILTLDFLVSGLPEESFRPSVTRNGLYLEVATVVPPFFLSKLRVIQTTEESSKHKANQHKVNSFAKVVAELKAKHEYNPIVHHMRVKLPLKVDRDKVDYELQVFPHDDDDLAVMTSYFILSVELVSVIKPRSEIFTSKKVLKVYSSPSAKFGCVADPAYSVVSKEDSMQEEY